MQDVMFSRIHPQADTTPAVDTPSNSLKQADPDSVDAQRASTERDSLIRQGYVSRSVPPFIATHDIPRGIIFAFQACLAYILMLAVMYV